MVVLVVLVDHGEEEGVVAFLDQTENSIALFYFIPVLKQGFFNLDNYSSLQLVPDKPSNKCTNRKLFI